MSEEGESDCEGKELRGEASCRDFFHYKINSEIAKGPFVWFFFSFSFFFFLGGGGGGGERVLVQGIG